MDPQPEIQHTFENPVTPHRKINWLLIIIIIIGFFSVLTVGYFLGTSSSRSKAVELSAEPTPTEYVMPTTAAESNREVGSNIKIQQGPGKVAYIYWPGSISEGGNIWTSNPDGSSKQQITTDGHIENLTSWSPDNKYILADGSMLVDTQTGHKTVLPVTWSEEGGNSSDLVWTSNSELAYIVSDVLYKIKTDGSKTEVDRIPSEGWIYRYYLNKTANKLAYDTAEPDGIKSDIFTYDFVAKQKTQISQSGNASILGWLGNNVAYQEGVSNSLWSSSPDGKTKNKLADLDGWSILHSALSQNGNKIFYSAGFSGEPSASGVFVYDKVSGKITEINKLDDFNSFSNTLSISKDSDFGAYILSKKLLLFNFKKNNTVTLCETYCIHPIWQN